MTCLDDHIQTQDNDKKILGTDLETDLRLHVLGTGSKGNTSVIETPKGLILIDCGLSCRQIFLRMQTLGLDPANVQAILITHEHTDHIAGLRVTAKKLGVPVYASQGTIDSAPWPREVIAHPLAAWQEISIAQARITAFHVPHDAAETFGYRITCGQETIGFCTDIGSVTNEAGEALSDTTILALESNYDPRMLQYYPGYPYPLKARIGSDSGHLSNDQAANALASLVTTRTRTIVGMHISQHTNLPSVAQSAFDNARTHLSDACQNVRVIIGNQDRPVSL